MSGHLSMRPTWTSPGRVDGPAWPCTGRGLPGRRVTATPVRSYRTISPLPVRDSRVAAPSAVYFCGTFPRVSPGGRYPPPRPLVSGLSSRGFLSPRGRSARASDGSARPRNPRPERADNLVAIASNILSGCRQPSSPEREAASGGRSRSSSPAAASSSSRPTSTPTPPRATAEAIGAGRDLAGARRPRRGGLPGAAASGDLPRRLARPLGQQRRRARHRQRLGAGRGGAAGDGRRQRGRHDERHRRRARADDRGRAAAT